MTDYTPGPWKVDVLDAAYNTCDVVIARYLPNTADVIAEVMPDWSLESGEGSGWANANLLASAPEMYEALEWLLHIVHGVGKAGGPLESGELDDATKAGKAALAKARGES